MKPTDKQLETLVNIARAVSRLGLDVQDTKNAKLLAAIWPQGWADVEHGAKQVLSELEGQEAPKEWTLAEAMTKAGFKATWTKPDNRGEEYGTFYAHISERDGTASVTKKGGEEPNEYTLIFHSLHCLVNWAKD
jgi:hypothetical protein